MVTENHVELLNETPLVMFRPLMSIKGKAYAATWLSVRTTISEEIAGNKVIEYDPPIKRTEQLRFIIREDGQFFGPDGKVWRGDKDDEQLGFDVRLDDSPPVSRIWSLYGVVIYRAGYRPDPADLFNMIVDVVDRFVDFDRSLEDQQTMSELVACYILTTWFLDGFNVIGYLWPSGDRGTGKTTLLILISELSYLGQLILMGGSYATLRDLADYGATLCFDDAENLFHPKTDLDKRALLLAGNRKGAIITVKEKQPNGQWRNRHVNAYCPRSFSSVKVPDPILGSRSIGIPLVRTLDRQKANADPLDYSLWPHDREELIVDLWALGLAHLSELPKYDVRVNDLARLSGRSLQPWRSILAVALWLEDSGITGLWQRMEELSWNYQNERSRLELTDLTTLVIRALCHCADSAISANNKVRPEKLVIKVRTKQVTGYAKQIAEEEEADSEWINNKRVGRVLSQLRLDELPRPGGKGSRIRGFTLANLWGLCQTYNLPFPHNLSNGTNGFNGSNGTVEVEVPERVAKLCVLADE